MDDEKNLTLIVVTLVVLAIALIAAGIVLWMNGYIGLAKALFWMAGTEIVAGLVSIGVALARKRRR